ncbi:hypothetical protein PUN28_020566 [Cardiocondyla obscurior]|uniref:Uncharacterized protein n=1 Tax=Cardiocondyla obscurior TaxID=286306 RepID=A0AAW2E8N9_9HYME
MLRSGQPSSDFYYVPSHRINIGLSQEEYECSNCGVLVADSQNIRHCLQCQEAIRLFLIYLERNPQDQPYLNIEATIIYRISELLQRSIKRSYPITLLSARSPNPLWAPATTGT